MRTLRRKFYVIRQMVAHRHRHTSRGVFKHHDALGTNRRINRRTTVKKNIEQEQNKILLLI
jgi:hypothetical protein